MIRQLKDLKWNCILFSRTTDIVPKLMIVLIGFPLIILLIYFVLNTNFLFFSCNIRNPILCLAFSQYTCFGLMIPKMALIELGGKLNRCNHGESKYHYVCTLLETWKIKYMVLKIENYKLIPIKCSSLQQFLTENSCDKKQYVAG